MTAAEESYWRFRFANEPYRAKGYDFDDYAPAYRIGYAAHARYPGRSLEDIEPLLERDYAAIRGSSPLAWIAAREATHAAWMHARVLT